MARNRGAAVPAASAVTASVDAATTERIRIPTNGPHDGDTLAPEITPAPGTVDFGALRVPVPVGGTVSVEPTTAGRIQAVHVTVPEGRLSVSALAAPRTGGLWADLATEIDASLREGGARVRSFTGQWGRELHATTAGATSVFVGVDGSRWMLYGVATGPTRDAVNLDARLRRMLRGTIVVRGKAPYPVRTVLPLVAPSAQGSGQQAVQAGPSALNSSSVPSAPSAPPTMTLRAPAPLSLTSGGQPGAADGATVNGTRPRTGGALPAAAAAGAGPNGVRVGGLPTDGARAVGSNTGGTPSGPVTGAAPAFGPGTGAAAVPASGPAGSARPAAAAPRRRAAPTGAFDTGANVDGAPRPVYPDIADAEPGTSPYGVPHNGAPRRPTSPARPEWSRSNGHASAGASGSVPAGGAPRGRNRSDTAGGHPVPPGPITTDRAERRRPPDPAGAPSGGFLRPTVPAAWAHESGGHDRHLADPSAGGSLTAPYRPTEQIRTPPPSAALPPAPTAAPLPPLPETSSPLPETFRPPTLPDPLSTARPDQRPSWPDAAPAAADREAVEHWDPLTDPLPIDLDPLPAPDPAWTNGPGGRYSGDGPGRRRGRDGGDGPGVAGPHRRAADRLSDPDAGGSAPRWRAADLLVGRDGAQDVAEEGNGRWRAADLLVGRDGAQDVAEDAVGRWRAADLLARRDGEMATGGRREPDAAAEGEILNMAGGGSPPATRRADRAAVPRWRAAELLEGRAEPGRVVGAERAVQRRGTTTRAGTTEPMDGPAEPRRRIAASEVARGTDDEDAAARRWAADHLAGQARLGDIDPAVTAWPAAQRQNDGAGRDAVPVARWRAADLLDRGADGGAGEDSAASRWRAAGTSAAGTWGAADLMGNREQSGIAGSSTAERLDRRTAGSLVEDSSRTRWRAAELLDRRDNGRPRRRAHTSDAEGPLAEDGHAISTRPAWGDGEPSSDTRAGRRRRGAAHGDAPRHGDGDRHTVPAPRVPPTQWAWPKEEPAVAPDLVPARRTPGDGRRTGWDAADLLDEGRHAGGRRRKPEPSRHSAPAEEAGRHYRP